MQNKISTTKKILIAVAILNVCLAAVFGYAVFITRQIAIVIDSQGQLVLQEVAKTDKARQVAELIKEAGPMQEQMKQYFVSSDNIIEFSEYLESLATRSNVTLTKSIGQPSREGLPVSLTFKGSFDNTLYFVGLIESLPYVLSVESVSLDGPVKKEIAKISDIAKGQENKKVEDLWSGSINIILVGSGQN